MAHSINLPSLVRQLTDLQRPIQRPTFSSAIIHPDYIIIYWNEIPRQVWGSLPFKVPNITNTCIEYKKMTDSVWNEIKTYSDQTTACCFYKINPIHNYSLNHQSYNFFWNEYNVFEEDCFYDIRFCFENYHERKNWTTLSSLGIPSLPPSYNFCGFLSKNIKDPIPNQCYLVLENNDEQWKEYKNCLAMYSNSVGIHGWIIYYPRKGWTIDNFYYDGHEWIDVKLKNTMMNLYKSMHSKDIIFKILSLGFTSRFLSKNILDTYYNKYIKATHQ